jgi:NAD(P)-dependent dehydrogenase (short-subunit alcohol dehydrogenase family)
MTSTQEEKVWLITGCSTGMGHEFAREALRCGDRVVATARNPESLAGLVAEHPERAAAIELDVTRREQIERAVTFTLERFGRLDVLINNAAYGYLAAIEEGDEQEVRAMFETNFWGTVAMTQAVLPLMRSRRSGQIINNSSQAGLMSRPGTGYYSTTKYAVEAFTEALAAEVAPLGIRVTALEPGPFRTDWAGRSMKQASEKISDYANVHARTSMIQERAPPGEASLGGRDARRMGRSHDPSRFRIGVARSGAIGAAAHGEITEARDRGPLRRGV